MGTAAMLAGPQTQATPIAPAMMGHSVLDFGVEANTETDQSPALQRALNEIAASGHPAFLPPGVYQTGNVTLPQQCHLHGVARETTLIFNGAWLFASNSPYNVVSLDGLSFMHDAKVHHRKNDFGLKHYPIITVNGGQLKVQNCLFKDLVGSGLAPRGSSVNILNSTFESIGFSAIFADNVRDSTISGCIFNKCWAGVILTASAEKAGSIIANSHFNDCDQIGIQVQGRAIVTANLIKDCKKYGLKLGDPKGTSHILASQNSITNCRVGIACEAEGDYIFATLNMIQGAKDGAIRAIADGKLVGPDLSQRSSESYRNLAIVGNVAL
ncbi:MAG: right-handed parallel beta-helix repeat-containing protein [Hyphomicrobiales bacterium]|nr:right-handed parallel beta-helix repeat-containing protein [Hyphomicrobiales bacterium]